MEHKLRNARAQADLVKRLVDADKDPGDYNVPHATKAGKTRRRSSPAVAAAAAAHPPPPWRKSSWTRARKQAVSVQD